jgi:hypothetical protein
MTEDTEFTAQAAKLAEEMGDICDTHEKGDILNAISMLLADVVQDLELEEAVPVLLEVLQDAVVMAYDVDTSVVPVGKMQ